MRESKWKTVVMRRYRSWEELPDEEARGDARIALDLFPGWSPAWEELLMPLREVAVEGGFGLQEVRDSWLAYAGWSLIRRIKEQGIQTHLVLAKGQLEGKHRLAAALYLNLCVVPVYRAIEDWPGTEVKEIGLE